MLETKGQFKMCSFFCQITHYHRCFEGVFNWHADCRNVHQNVECSVNIEGNVYWKRFLNVLHPAYTPPTRHALSTHLLDAESNRGQVKVKQIIEKADCIAIISDGWSNICGQGIINIISTPQPVFYKSTDTRDNRHQSLHCRWAEGSHLGPQKVFALVTDNAVNLKAAWSKVEKSYPHITPIGCAAHALNLLLKDIVLLKTMDTLYKRAKEMVRYV